MNYDGIGKLVPSQEIDIEIFIFEEIFL